MRLFIAIELIDQVREEVVRIRERLVESLARQGVRFVGPDKLHLTLAFLGEVPSEQVRDLASQLDALSATRSFQLNLAGIGAFPDMRRPKVIWIGAEGEVDAARELSLRVAAAARPFAPEMDMKPFAAHITLARIKPGSKEVGRILAALDVRVNPGVLDVRSFSLIHSRPDGEYETLSRVALRDPGT